MILKFYVDAVLGGICDRIFSYLTALKLRKRLGSDAEIDYFWKKCYMCDCDFDDLFIVPDFVNLQKEGSLNDTRRLIRLEISINKEDISLIENDLTAFLTEKAGFKGFGQSFFEKIRADKIKDNIVSLFVDGTDLLDGKPGVISNNELELIEPLAKREEAYAHQLGISKEIIGICVRGADRRNRTKEMKELYDGKFNEVRRTMRTVLKHTPHQKFFLSSDDKDYQRILLDEFPRSILYRKDVHFPPQDVSVTAKYPRTKESIQDGAINLWLLSKTNYNEKVPLDIRGSKFVNFPLFIKKQNERDSDSIDINVGSIGGCASSMWQKFLSGSNLNIGEYSFNDKFKHKLPMLKKEIEGFTKFKVQLSSNYKKLIILSDPINSILSVFRRGYQKRVAKLMNPEFDSYDNATKEQLNSLESYAVCGKDLLGLNEYYRRWISDELDYDVIFIKYETMWGNIDEIFKVLNIDPNLKFPNKIKRNSHIQETDNSIVEKLMLTYGGLRKKIEEMEDVTVRTSK